MYSRIVLAYDGSLEGALALREGALLAKRCGARVFLLSVVPHTAGTRMADSVHAGALSHQMDSYKTLIERGVARLKALGMEPVARLVVGEPVREIAAFAKEVSADLVVVGHQKKNMVERWWSGPSGAYICDAIRCSVLIGRNRVSDEAFEAALEASPAD